MGAELPKIVNVNCNHCGASLQIGEETRFVTCAYCHSQLAVERTDSSIHTARLEKIERQTDQIADNLKVIELQNNLSQLDREWQQSREDLMVRGQNGAPVNSSAFGGIFAIIVGLVGGMAFMIFTARAHAPAFFPLFGGVFMVAAVAGGAISLVNAGKVDTLRADYEARRRELLSAIEAEKSAVKTGATSI